MNPWRGINGSEFAIIDARRLRSNRWGALAQSQTLPAQPAAWGDTWPHVMLGAALLGALVGWVIAGTPW